MRWALFRPAAVEDLSGTEDAFELRSNKFDFSRQQDRKFKDPKERTNLVCTGVFKDQPRKDSVTGGSGGGGEGKK